MGAGPSAAWSLKKLLRAFIGSGPADDSASASVEIQDPAIRARRAELDNLFKVLIGIDSAHHEVHEGDSFSSSAVDESMADAATLIVAFKTMASAKRAHMIIEFTTLVGGTIVLIEGPTWTNQTGALSPVFNRKREASMESSGLLEDQAQAAFAASDNLISNPTGLAGGATIYTFVGFGKKEKFAGGGRDISEWLLKPDTQYAVRFTADGGSNAAQIVLNWYEHTDE